MLNRVGANVFQSRTLAQLRDLLLPKLLSSALRVRDAERMIGDAA
jgi:type I restriction enzyme S subunit